MSILIRRLILALATLASLAPAFAQSPPPVPALPDTERRTSYSISGTTCACSVGFQLFGDSTDYGNWVQVWLNGKQVLFNDPSFGWSISTATTGGLAGAPRPITNAILTFNLPQTGTVQIVGARRPRRTQQFQESQPVPTRNVNQVFSDIIATQRELWDKTNDITGRGLFSQPGNTVGPLPLPAVCVNAFLAFDATGLNPLCQQILTAGTLATPGSVVNGDFAVWSGTTGKILADGGNLASPPAIGGTTPGAGTFSSLKDTAIAGSTQCVQANSVGTLSGTGSGCASNTGASVDNLLPNNQWRSWSGLTWVTTQNAAGTAAESIPSCASFTLTTADPLFTCANTQQLKVGDLIIVSNIISFWGFPSAGYETCVQVACTNGFVTAAKITALNTNTNVTLHSPGFSGVSPTSSIAANLAPISPGDNGVTTSGPDGWTKAASLIATVDTWGASATPASTVYPGCERPLLLRKGVTGSEPFVYIVPASQLALWQGQTVTLGVAIYQRVQGGASTGNAFIQDSVGTTFSAALTGASLGGFQFLNVTRTISQTATSLQIGFQGTGNSGDVFDVCLPTAAFVSSMTQSQLHTNSFEKVIADSHYNPPTMTPFIIAFPTANMGGVATTLFGYNTNDMEALSFGTIHNAGHVYAKLEWRTTTTWLGCNIFQGGFVNTVNGALTFGLQAVGQVNNIVFPTSMTPIPLYHVGGTFALYTDCNNSTGVVGVGTWDYTDSDNNGPTSFQ